MMPSEIPTRAQVQAALADAKSGRPPRPLDDIEAVKVCNAKAAQESMRRNDARTRALVEAVGEALRPLRGGRPLTNHDRLMLGPVVADLVVLGIIPATVPAPVRKR